MHSSGSARGLLVWKAPLTVNPGAGKAADAERLDGTNSDGFMRYLTRYVTARGRRRPSGYGQPATRWRPATRGDVEDSTWRYSLMNWGHDPLK